MHRRVPLPESRVWPLAGSPIARGSPRRSTTTRSPTSCARSGPGLTEARAPVYSHATYDIVDGETQVVGRPDVLVLEGLPFPEDHVDFTVYLDADEADIERWYLERFRALCVDARTDDTSFFRPLADLSDDQAAEFAHRVWTAINHVNLEEHILPVRDGSDVILEKGPDHAVRRVRLRID